MTKMNDISWCQGGRIDWPNLRPKNLVGGLLIRMSQDSYRDSKWFSHSGNAIQYKVPFVPWHFVQPEHDHKLQVAIIKDTWKALPWKPKVFGFDFENIYYKIYGPDGKTVIQIVNIFPPSREMASVWLMLLIQGVMAATGLPQSAMMIYTRADYWDQWILPAGSKVTYEGVEYTIWDWSKCKLWVANWLVYSPYISYPRDWKSYTVWQKAGGTNTETYIEGPVDLDDFNGDQTALEVTFGVPVPVAPVVVAPPYTTKIANCSYLAVCVLPDPTSTAVAWLKLGDTVTVLEEKNGWGRISSGWISLYYTDGVKIPVVLNFPCHRCPSF